MHIRVPLVQRWRIAFSGYETERVVLQFSCERDLTLWLQSGGLRRKTHKNWAKLPNVFSGYVAEVSLCVWVLFQMSATTNEEGLWMDEQRQETVGVHLLFWLLWQDGCWLKKHVYVQCTEFQQRPLRLQKNWIMPISPQLNPIPCPRIPSDPMHI